MMTIADEIQAVADNADKCVNYPIGDKLEACLKQQDKLKPANFVLAGVLIFAAAKIYGRKVDYLEQEIHGIAKNFEAVCAADNKPDKEEKKKTRTKKFVIQDRVNLEKIRFEERPIQVLEKVDINKTLAVPSKINRLQKMKEFFVKSKARGGKLVIPKSLLFNNDFVLCNFGLTQIYEFDDNKEVVGSRRDFTSFSFYINNSTGELQSDISAHISNHGAEKVNSSVPDIRADSPVYWDARPYTPSPDSPSRPSTPVNVENCNQQAAVSKDLNHLNINLDEGIELDEELLRTNLLLPTSPVVKLIDIVRKSPKLFPPDLQLHADIKNFDDSIVQNELTTDATELEPAQQMSDSTDFSKMKNLLMIPLKKLKHRCAFNLPDEVYGELKKLKRDQFKGTTGLDATVRQARTFKTLDMLRADAANDDDDEPFLGFTTEQQKAPLTSFPELVFKRPAPVRCRSPSPVNERKYSNDSGLSLEESINLNTSNENTSPEITASEASSQSQHENTTLNEPTAETSNLNINSGDSCYQSCISGDSMKTDLSSFFNDCESQNNMIADEAEFVKLSTNESEERVLQMQQTAMNIAKWKEYLKPILADSEARSKIDMHQYGIEMINKIGNVNDSASLNDITETGRTPAYFLSMLQLINNSNIVISHGERSMTQPVDLKDILITLKSKTLHREKFEEMGQQFVLQEEKKTTLKRKAVQTSTPARSGKRFCDSSLGFNSINISQSMVEDMNQSELMLSQGSSGYCSQMSSESMMSDC